MEPASFSRESAAGPRWAAAVLVGVVLATYASTFSVPLLFDDQPSIVDNPTLRHLWPLWNSFSPPHGRGLTVEGRPLLNFTLALNYAVSGVAPWSYHALNLVFHALATLTLFGLVQRTVGRVIPNPPRLAASRESTRAESNRRVRDNAPYLVAFATALLWAVHPLQTESVTYVVQRAESLMGLLYLATLYFFRRGADSFDPAHRRGWFTLAVIACTLGMATKEVMVTAPFIAWLYDRTLVSGTFREAWKRHRFVHLGLASTWLLLIFLVVGSGDRGGTIGATSGVNGWEYALTQSRAVFHYLRLAIWPSPLIFDYGSDFVTVGEAAPYLLGAIGLLALTGFTLWRRPALGFLGAWFFVILAPTSSFIGGTRQMLGEHRMYLSLAAVSALSVLALQKFLGPRFWIAALILATALGAASFRRNADYASELTLYRDTVAKRPGNGFAHYNLGKVYADAGRHAEAATEFSESVRLMPQAAQAHFNLGNSLVELGHTSEARAQYEAALRIDPRYEKAHFNLGNLWLSAGEKTAALKHFDAAVAIDPQHLEARTNLGGVLLELGTLNEAREQFEWVVRAQPASVEAHFGLGNIFTLQQQWTDAAREFETVLRLRPDLAVARERLEVVRSRR